jgi:hypothetical protein
MQRAPHPDYAQCSIVETLRFERKTPKALVLFSLVFCIHNASDKAVDSTKHCTRLISFIQINTVLPKLAKNAAGASCTTAKYNNWCVV